MMSNRETSLQADDVPCSIDGEMAKRLLLDLPDRARTKLLAFLLLVSEAPERLDLAFDLGDDGRATLLAYWAYPRGSTDRDLRPPLSPG